MVLASPRQSFTLQSFSKRHPGVPQAFLPQTPPSTLDSAVTYFKKVFFLASFKLTSLHTLLLTFLPSLMLSAFPSSYIVVSQWSSTAWLSCPYLFTRITIYEFIIYIFHKYAKCLPSFTFPPPFFFFLNSKISSCVYSHRQHTLSYQSLFRHCKTTELCLGHVLRCAL